MLISLHLSRSLPESFTTDCPGSGSPTGLEFFRALLETLFNVPVTFVSVTESLNTGCTLI